MSARAVEDRREIFEEAAGISRFRYRKEESERRLSQAEENLLRLRDILSELEDRVGPLKEQAEKAQQYLEFAGEKRTLGNRPVAEHPRALRPCPAGAR